MRLVPKANLDLLHQFEQGPHGGCALFPYYDPVGDLTIGWGHRVLPTEPKRHYPITEADADALASSDLVSHAADLERELGEDITGRLTDGQFGALVDFVFNLGIHTFVTSSMFHFIRTGLLVRVPDEFPKWVYGRVNGEETKLPGLIERRAAERALWLS